MLRASGTEFEEWPAGCTASVLPRIFAKDVLPYLGKRAVYEIKRNDLLEVIARIERRNGLSVTEKARTWFGQLFRYALVSDRRVDYAVDDGAGFVTRRLRA